MDLSKIWLYCSPPVIGAIIGYFTNDIAISMLFRPYEAIYIGKWKLPFTPGLIPSNQNRLAQRISDTIMGALLTPDELQKLAQKLLQTERVQGAINWLLQLALEQIKPDKSEKTTQILAGILRDLFSQSLPRILQNLAQKEDFLELQLNHIFDEVILEFQLSEDQADKLAEWLLTDLLTPDVLREGIINFLTDRNIQLIDDSFRSKSSGTYWVIANLFGLQNTLMRLRIFCLDEKKAANQTLKDLLQILEMQKKFKELFQNLSLQSLPVSTVRQLRKTIRDSVRNYLQNKGSEFLQGLSQSVEWENIAALILNRLRKSSIINISLELVSQELALILDKYLEKDLEKIVAQIIPILNIDQVIINRVNATSPADLEAGIQGIVKSELQAIVNLGGILGFIVGLMQTILFLFQQAK
jgi:uncharacterized membrane protein YheB (UPF0754 family)